MTHDDRHRARLNQIVSSVVDQEVTMLAGELLANDDNIERQIETRWQQNLQRPPHEADRGLVWLTGKLQMVDYIPKLGELYQKTQDTSVRQALLHSLGMMESTEANPYLFAVLQSDAPTDVRISAAYALQIGQRPEAITPLLTVAMNPNESPSLRGMAIESLSYQADKTLVPTLLPLLNDAAPEVRFWALYTIGEIGDKGFADQIAALSQDEAHVEPYGSIGQEACRILEKWSAEDA
jgi:hypothetical protein